MENEDCAATLKSQDAPRSPKEASTTLPNGSGVRNTKDCLGMESGDCGIDLSTWDPTQGKEKVHHSSTVSLHEEQVPTPLPSQTADPKVVKNSTDMEGEGCGAALDDRDTTQCDRASGQSMLLSSQCNSHNLESEGCAGASDQSMLLSSQCSSHNLESEGCAVTLTNEQTTVCPTDVPLHLSSFSNGHSNFDMKSEDYSVMAVHQNNTTSCRVEALVPTSNQPDSNDSFSMGSEVTAAITSANQNAASHPGDSSTPVLTQDEGASGPMTPTDSSSHPPVALLPLSDTPSHSTVILPPTDTTDPENKSCEGNGDSRTNTKSGKKVKKGIKRKIPSVSKGIQTSVHLNSSSVFSDRVIDLPMLKREAGVVSVEALQDLDVALEEWPILLVSQLKLRDTIIDSINSVVQELVKHGQVLEQDMDYLKLKILELRQEAKVKAKENQQQSHKKQGKVAESQTTEEDLAEAWSRWYYGCWGDYYSECDPTSSSYWPGHYTKQSTVLNKTKAIENKEMQETVAEEESEGNERQPQVGENCKEEMKSKKKDVIHQHAESDEAITTVKRKKLKGKRKKERHKNEKTSKEIVSAEKEESESPNAEKRMRRKKKKNKKRDDRGEESDDTQTTDSSANTQLTQSINTSGTKSAKEVIGKEEEEEERKEDSHGWDTSQNITQQVVAAAAQAVVNSGYVFQEELGLYYDYNTSYYYNAENGLYYDTKSGTYFYYDHDTQSYQFHSQVSPTTTSTTTKRRRKRTAKKDSRKLSDKNEDLREKEEGECTESEDEGEEEEDEEGGSEEEEGEKGNMTLPDHQEGVPAAADVPPSLRLMVVEGGERVRVGELHVVTLTGGTVGREVTNDVHLPDLNISKVHAEIEYHSAGSDDHHYCLRDLGSNNGTFVNGVRLSEARQASRQVEVGHGWEIQFGSIKVKCHLHPGTLTCNECEPGLVLQGLPSQPGVAIASFKNSKCKERARRKELKAMQKKYKLTHHEAQASSSAPAPGYTDRTLLRQVQKGSDNPYEKTEVASSEVPLRETNRGFALLQKMGWSQGQGLGKSNTGITEPVQPVSVVGQGGLGSTQPSVLPPADPWAERRRKQLQITQERFNQSPPANH